MAKRPKAKRKMVKAPQAPRGVKSAYMHFSTDKHRELRQDPANKKLSTPAIAKLVSSAWNSLSDQERQRYYNITTLDRERYEYEKSLYKGPLRVPVCKLPAKLSKPKMPASSFIMYMTDVRPIRRESFTHLSNDELTKLIAQEWKAMPVLAKQHYKKKASTQREQFYKELKQWNLEHMSETNVLDLENYGSTLTYEISDKGANSTNNYQTHPNSPNTSSLTQSAVPLTVDNFAIDCISTNYSLCSDLDNMYESFGGPLTVPPSPYHFECRADAKQECDELDSALAMMYIPNMNDTSPIGKSFQW